MSRVAALLLTFLIQTTAVAGSTAQLMDAVRDGNLATASDLTGTTASINERQGRFTPLAIAVVKGDLPMVNLLLNRPSGRSQCTESEWR